MRTSTERRRQTMKSILNASDAALGWVRAGLVRTTHHRLALAFASVLAVLSVFAVGCTPPSGTAADTGLGDDDSAAETGQFRSDDLSNLDVPVVGEAEAMQIAMTGLSKKQYRATSTIIGPMVDATGADIEAYEVTVNGGDHVLLRYVNADTGELMTDKDARHDIVAEPNLGDLPDGAHAAYYTSCPGGWPLCIYDPDSITFYSQRDPSWSGKPLGFGPSTIGSAGCVLSSYAMMLRKNGRGTRNPDELNSLGKEHREDAYGYCFSGDLIKHKCIAERSGASLSTLSVDQVWSTLASGKAVVAYGYSTCLGSNHAQMLWGHDGSRYWTKDPWYDWTTQDQAMCLNSPTYRLMK
ncbi:hypothetical protein L6R50_21500 [Myxococcota bacterium]|nr:hypothetical protein [Myxococcota bacterium]